MKRPVNSDERLFRLVLLIALFSSLSSTPVLAGSGFCKLRAYVVDHGSDLLNVRQQPGSQSKILGKLPGNADVRILKTEGRWMLIAPVSSASQNIEFQGQGWVFNSFLGLSTRGYDKKTVAVFSKANANSGITGRITSNTSVRLLSCQGEWALVEKNGVRGWLRPKDQCAAPFTTCS
jgi:uncharacterized protein YgiM (DUF1202 family)